MRVECSNLKCKYMSDKGICKAKKINLSLNGVNTVNNGFQDYLKCNNFEKDQEYALLEEKINNIFKTTKF